jgi:hypothetical protein
MIYLGSALIRREWLRAIKLRAVAVDSKPAVAAGEPVNPLN